MFGNHSIFDLVELPSTPGPCEKADAAGYGGPTLLLTGLIPSLLLIISVLVLLKQNIDRVISLITLIINCFRRTSHERSEEETFNFGSSTFVVRQGRGFPRNLCDSELAAREIDVELGQPLESVV